MESLVSIVTEFWDTLAPTTWLILGLLISLSFLKKALF
jgi:hypothetical protein